MLVNVLAMHFDTFTCMQNLWLNIVHIISYQYP